MSAAQARERLGIAEGVVAIGCVARLEEQKGHRFLLQALALLNDDPEFTYNFKAILVGDGRLRKSLEEDAAALGVAACTVFLGTRQNIAEILRALDIYVMPSLWEGLSIAMLEAMSASLPVVISNVGGVSQVIGNNEYGVHVPPGDAAELAKAIRSLIEEPQRRAVLGARARQRVLDKFSMTAMLRALTQIYEEMRPARPYP
jgi:glycosyltransferase involved in cell wall biosynthesis